MDKALVLNGTANELIHQLQTPEACAAFYLDHLDAFEAVTVVWRHVKENLLLAGRGGSPIAAGDGRLVLAEPAEYDVNLEVVRELAPDCIKTAEVDQSDVVKRIHDLAGQALEQVIVWEEIDVDALEVRLKEIVQLSQPQTVDKVDGRKLQAALGRGDARAAELIRRGAKVAVRWRLVVQ